jgi:hypothetical protein
MESRTTTTPSAPARPSPARRINPRLLVLCLVLLAPVSWMVYTFVKLTVTEGIEQVGQYKEVNLKAMGNFAFDEVNGGEKDVPPVYRALDGQKVLLVGEMFSGTSSAPQVDSFQLVYSIAKCCFGGPPKVQERVFAQLPPGKRVPVYDRLAKVYGTLHVRAQRENGRVVSLFDLDVEKVEGQE